MVQCQIVYGDFAVGTPFYSRKLIKQRELGRTAAKCRGDADSIENMLEFHFLKRKFALTRISQHGETPQHLGLGSEFCCGSGPETPETAAAIAAAGTVKVN